MNTYNSRDQLPLTLNAEQIAAFLGISRAGAYQLFHRKDFPCVKLGKRMLVEREKFFMWLDDQTQGANEKATAE